MVLRGKVLERLTENTAWDGWTCWSKDGSQIYFSSKRDGNDEIYVMKSNGGGVKRLTENPAKDVAPAISPDGTEIAFVSDRDGNEDIYIMSVDGTAAARLTNTPAKEQNPQWSPDGNHLVCYATSEGRMDQVLVVDAATGEAQVVGNDTTRNFYPTWTADGQSVVYACSPSENEKWVYSASLDGAKNEKLLPLPAFYPKYAPDGKRIAYIAGAWPSSNIYVIDYSDGTLRCLTCDLQLAPAPSEELANKKSKSQK
jgi:Tol biopolymer transport system component